MRDAALLLLPALLLGCTAATRAPSSERERPVPTADSMVGEWRMGDGLSYNLGLDLRDDGSFEARWSGCLGDMGKASGSWSRTDQGVRFTVESGANPHGSPLREARRILHRGQVLLVLPEFEADLKARGMRNENALCRAQLRRPWRRR